MVETILRRVMDVAIWSRRAASLVVRLALFLPVLNRYAFGLLACADQAIQAVIVRSYKYRSFST